MIEKTWWTTSGIAVQFLLHISRSEFAAAAVLEKKVLLLPLQGPAVELQHQDSAHLTVKLNQFTGYQDSSITFDNIKRNYCDKHKIVLTCVHCIE